MLTWKQHGEPNSNAFTKTEAFDGRRAVIDSAKAAFRWSGDESEVRRLQEERGHHYLRWTFLSTVAVMIVGVIGVGLSFLH
jgi:hypothetical protein